MYIDGSSLYGSSEEDYPGLREFTGGKRNSSYYLQEHFIPSYLT